MMKSDRLSTLRERFSSLGIDGLLIPMSDRFLSEYVPAHENRIAFLTGFTGSAATLVVLRDKAAFFTDGRYTLQAKGEVDATQFEIINSGDVSVAAWLKQQGKLTIGVDASRISIADCERYGALTLLDENPVDAVWKDRPSFTPSNVWEYPVEFAGEASAAKITRVAKTIAEQGADAAFIGSSESVNWLMNIRGADVEATPVLHSVALVFATGEVQVFTYEGERTFDALPAALAALAGKRVMLERTTVAPQIREWLKGAELIYTADPCALPRAIKNSVELAAIREVHKRDGAALSSALSQVNAAQDELGVDALLLAMRQKQEGFLYPSFPTIAGMGEHGAIVHYRATPASNAALTEGLLLIDSGGQYVGGTTDVTRTVAIGMPMPAQKAWFTRVLKGHIALAMAQFPKGTTGSQLDALARQFLWGAGGDFDHGTGHGVGNCLGVHEGPQRISKRPSDVALQAGMILSNEPGYYEEGAFGIRIENLVVVVEKGDGFLGFETITLAPIDRHLIDSTLLTTQEREWVDAYHARVFETLELRVDSEVANWLKTVCAPLNVRVG
jgi:Xaa-Pro aminopeptidase